MKNWINTKDKKCLVVQGARQTGKTYTVERFAEENYEELVEINFKQMPSAMEIFSGDLTVDAMVMGMRFRFPEKKIIPGKTLIFLDEIQECQEAVTSLKFWAIDNKYDVIVSGSLLGIDYNVPGQAMVTLTDGKKKLYEGELPITQFGVIEYLAPVLFNKNSTIKVYFDPNTGGLLKVDREEGK